MRCYTFNNNSLRGGLNYYLKKNNFGNFLATKLRNYLNSQPQDIYGIYLVVTLVRWINVGEPHSSYVNQCEEHRL
jgi:hypothetical protein